MARWKAKEGQVFLTQADKYQEATRAGRSSDRARTVAGVAVMLAGGATVLAVISGLHNGAKNFNEMTLAEKVVFGSTGIWGVALAEGLRASRQHDVSSALLASAGIVKDPEQTYVVPQEVAAAVGVPPPETLSNQLPPIVPTGAEVGQPTPPDTQVLPVTGAGPAPGTDGPLSSPPHPGST